MSRLPRDFVRFRYLTAAAVALATLAGASNGHAAAPEKLIPLVSSMKWSHVSGLIGYRGRLWFVNSVKYANHNSADVYSYDTATGKHRYERHLFSQDAGDPVIFRGLLYWPFEDSRWSPGRGEFMVTNGKNWRWGLLPEGRAFHVHTMTVHKGALFAAASAWRAHVQRSVDAGESWKPIFEFPSPKGKVSRITGLRSFGGSLYAGLTTWYDRSKANLLHWNGKTFKRVPRWPKGLLVSDLVPYRGWLYAHNNNGEEVRGGMLWRTDGRRVERMTAMTNDGIRGIAAGPNALWLVSANGQGGRLWRSSDGKAWQPVQDFQGMWPAAVAVHDGRVYVGAQAKAGGVLLGPASRTRAKPPGKRRPLPKRSPAPRFDTNAALAELDEVLGNALRIGELRGLVVPLAQRRDPALGRALAERLARRYGFGQVPMFGGRANIPATKFVRWYLMWAMAHNGYGRVPPSMIRTPFDARRNNAEKYLEPSPGAAWAAAELGQKDQETLSALMGRLLARGGPDWVDGDMIGALTVLTGQRFGYEYGSWSKWRERRKN